MHHTTTLRYYFIRIDNLNFSINSIIYNIKNIFPKRQHLKLKEISSIMSMDLSKHVPSQIYVN